MIIVQKVFGRNGVSQNRSQVLGDHQRGVEVRRRLVARHESVSPTCLNNLPYLGYDYEMVMGACAESVIGYMTIPLGAVGPLKLDGKEYMIPMATTEGCLVASTNRGCSALRSSGVISCLTNDGMSRAPVLRCDFFLQVQFLLKVLLIFFRCDWFPQN
jgi:hydroxymethylglutaryl-CoA reductase (NADPH)